jgi:hypothetical protein
MDFVLTADFDWASEFCIEHFLNIARRFQVRPTLFVTHESAAATTAAAQGRAELAIHPNFLPGSTHGDSVGSVTQHMLALVPGALAYRCHRYTDSSLIRHAMAAHGVKIDSNACLHLERGLGATELEPGVSRFPVFFEDDVHWSRRLGWNFGDFAADFFSRGLKILNFHPFFVALNVPDSDYYARHKPYIPQLTREQRHALRHSGQGTETFLIEALEAILAAGHRFVPLTELASAPIDMHSR